MNGDLNTYFQLNLELGRAPYGVGPFQARFARCFAPAYGGHSRHLTQKP